MMTKLEIELEKELRIDGLTANFDKKSVKDKLWQALIKTRIELEELKQVSKTYEARCNCGTCRSLRRYHE